MTSNYRHYSTLDQLLLQCQAGIETLLGKPMARRDNPAKSLKNPLLNAELKKQSAGFMRVNHTGEVCAQALYRGQLAFSKSTEVSAFLANAAEEETDHLAWCQERLHELGAHTSYLNVFWYTLAFLIGMLAGLSGEGISLGFVEETEKQVEAHLDSHLRKLPIEDTKSRAIVKQMQTDEIEHGQQAKQVGAVELPFMIKKLMALQARVMTTTAYWI